MFNETENSSFSQCIQNIYENNIEHYEQSKVRWDAQMHYIHLQQ